jgi:hypothetical protein
VGNIGDPLPHGWDELCTQRSGEGLWHSRYPRPSSRSRNLLTLGLDMHTFAARANMPAWDFVGLAAGRFPGPLPRPLPLALCRWLMQLIPSLSRRCGIEKNEEAQHSTDSKSDLALSESWSHFLSVWLINIRVAGVLPTRRGCYLRDGPGFRGVLVRWYRAV